MNSLVLSRVKSKAVLGGLTGGIALGLLWFWINGQGDTQPKPHNVPIAVVGPARVVGQLAVGLHRSDAFRVVVASSEADALARVEHRKADAIVNLETGQLQTAQAASSPAATVLRQIFASNPGGVSLHASELKPLRAQDPSGVALLFTAVALILAGYPCGVLLAFLSGSRRPTSVADAGVRTALILVFSGLTAFLVALFSGPILGYYSGHVLALWGWGTLLCASAMVAASALTALNVAGALVGLVVIVFFGIASSSVPIPWNFQSGIYRVLGPFVPDGAALDGLRNGIFFGSASVAQDLEVLAAWIVLPAVALIAIGRREERAAGAGDRTGRHEAIPAAAGGASA